MFEIGQLVIDTKKKIAPFIKAVLSATYPVIYILYDDDTDTYYITDELHLIKYDKHWFDNNM